MYYFSLKLNIIKEKSENDNDNDDKNFTLNIEDNFYTQIIRKIFLIISILIFFFDNGIEIEYNRKYAWSILRIIEIVLLIILLIDLLILQIFYIKLVKKKINFIKINS